MYTHKVQGTWDKHLRPKETLKSGEFEVPKAIRFGDFRSLKSFHLANEFYWTYECLKVFDGASSIIDVLSKKR